MAPSVTGSPGVTPNSSAVSQRATPSEPATPSPTPVGGTGAAWTPQEGETFQLQLSGVLDSTYEADVYEIEMDSPASAVERL